jgi:hypothetical protein
MERYDVVVIGGGISGVCAAIASGRMGLQTLLVDKEMMCGGVLTQSLVMPMMTFHSPRRQVVYGIGQEIVDRLVLMKGSYGHLPDPLGFVHTVTPFVAEKMREALLQLLREANVSVLLGCLCSEVRKEDNRVRSIRLISAYSQLDVEGSVFVDATGDGNIATKAGAPTLFHRQDCQPMTLMIHVSGVNKKEIRTYMKAHPKEFYLKKEYIGDYLAFSGFFTLSKKMEKAGINFKRDRLLFFETPFSDGEGVFNTTRYPGYAGDPFTLSGNQIKATLGVPSFIEFLKSEIPGFSRCQLVQTGIIGIRETNHVYGEKMLTKADILDYPEVNDSIACGAYPIDIHLSDDQLKTIYLKYPGEYSIPLRAIIPLGLDNVLLAGRAISADAEAFSAIRTSALASAIGHSAGVVAGLSVVERKQIRQLDYGFLRKKLLSEGVIL